MALRLGMLKCAAEGKNGCRLGIRKWTHVVAMAPPLDGALESSIASPQFTLPEFDANQDTSNNSSDFGFTFPGFSFGGSMELMAVPKRKKKGRETDTSKKSSMAMWVAESLKIPSGFIVLFIQRKTKIVIIINEGIYSEGESGRDEGKMKFGKQFNQQKVDCKGDIEDQVIDVNALPQDGCRKFYTTQFLRESEEGGELEVKFFKKFDEQLNKWRAQVLTTLVRRKVVILVLLPQTPRRAVAQAETPSGLEDMDVGRGVETSNDFQLEKSTYEQSGREHMESTIEMDRRNDYDQEESTHCPEVNEINATNYGNAHQEKDILIHYKFYP
ncbi:hypothetical protein POTOM_036426 [Populus tomentosa]|uniref:Uncharacterized protein n=1 Tax=Populus tomentosa TaxID=118781 RepID=A0A8X7Z0P7_POPTO|nr:hypothetical protein POTOM_036426 [Populus tomentosa]